MFKSNKWRKFTLQTIKLDNATTDPVSLILDFCWISVEWNKLVGVLNLYWCADIVAWLWRFHPLKEGNNNNKKSFKRHLSNWPQEGRPIQKNYIPTSFRSYGKLWLHNNINLYSLTCILRYHGFCPGADVPTGWVFGYIDLQITIRRVEPPGPLFLLFLQHKLKGAPQSQLIVLRWHSRHCGRNLHVILGAGLLTDNGVLVSVARSVSLQSPTKRKH